MTVTYQQVLACLNSCRMIGDGDIETSLIKSNATDAEATITIDHDLKLIMPTVKGSEGRKDWAINAQACLDIIGYYSDRSVKIHSGFDKAALSLVEGILLELEKVITEHNSYRIIYSGHSLGASTVTRIAHYLWDIINHIFPSIQPQQIVLFGSPHIGNDMFKKQIESMYHIYNYQNENDRVTKLLNVFPAYKHVGHIIKLDDITDKCKTADSKAASLFDHDLKNDYWFPITEMARKDGLHGLV